MDVPRKEEKASLLDDEAGWSFEKSGYWGIERAKGVIFSLLLPKNLLS